MPTINELRARRGRQRKSSRADQKRAADAARDAMEAAKAANKKAKSEGQKGRAFDLTATGKSVFQKTLAAGRKSPARSKRKTKRPTVEEQLAGAAEFKRKRKEAGIGTGIVGEDFTLGTFARPGSKEANVGDREKSLRELEGVATPAPDFSADFVPTAPKSDEPILDDETSTLEEGLMADLEKKQEEQRRFQEKQAAAARQLEESQLRQTITAGTRAADAQAAALAQGREGGISGTAPQVVSGFKQTVEQGIQDAQVSYQASEARRVDALARMEVAMEQQNFQLARELRQEAREYQAQAQDDKDREFDRRALLQREDRLDQEFALKKESSQQASFKNFTDLVADGTELSTEGIMSIADSMGIPFESAYAYYAGSQAVRDDKALSIDEKVIKNQQLMQNLQDDITGENIASVKQWSLIEDMYRAGASKDEISRAKDAFGLRDEDDPVFQAELRIKQADAKIKEMAASGEVPYGSSAWIDRQSKAYDLADQQKKYYEEYGGEWDTTAFKIGEAVGWCGDYATTLSTASRVGDMWSEKRTKIDDKNPTVGDKLLIPLGGADGFGHVATVLGFDPVSGNIHVAESNADGRQNRNRSDLGVATFGDYNVNELNASFGDDWGVAKGELKQGLKDAFQPSGGKENKNLVNRITLLAGRDSDKEQISETIKDYQATGNQEGLREFVTSLAIADLPATEQTKIRLTSGIVARGNDLISQMQEYEDAGGDLGIFSGTLTKAREKVNNVDPDKQSIAQSILTNIEYFGRAQTGAVISEDEVKTFKQILPGIYDGKDLASAKIDAFTRASDISRKDTIQMQIGRDLYEQVYGGEEPEQPKVDLLDIHNQFINTTFSEMSPAEQLQFASGGIAGTSLSAEELAEIEAEYK